jgi:dCMP deaminase
MIVFDDRPSRDQMLMAMATVVSQRSTCSRKHVGCVVAMEGRVLSTGYNGAPAGMPHCEHASGSYSHAEDLAAPSSLGIVDRRAGCKVSVHAEANAVAFAARHGVAIQGAELFTTMGPCLPCSQLIVNSGIIRVVCGAEHHRPMEREGLSLLQQAEIIVEFAVPILAG